MVDSVDFLLPLCLNQVQPCLWMVLYPIGSMYGIYANIWGISMANVTIYGIHGSYGYVKSPFPILPTGLKHLENPRPRLALPVWKTTSLRRRSVRRPTVCHQSSYGKGACFLASRDMSLLGRPGHRRIWERSGAVFWGWLCRELSYPKLILIW